MPYVVKLRRLREFDKAFCWSDNVSIRLMEHRWFNSDGSTALHTSEYPKAIAESTTSLSKGKWVSEKFNPSETQSGEAGHSQEFRLKDHVFPFFRDPTDPEQQSADLPILSSLEFQLALDNDVINSHTLYSTEILEMNLGPQDLATFVTTFNNSDYLKDSSYAIEYSIQRVEHHGSQRELERHICREVCLERIRDALTADNSTLLRIDDWMGRSWKVLRHWDPATASFPFTVTTQGFMELVRSDIVEFWKSVIERLDNPSRIDQRYMPWSCAAAIGYLLASHNPIFYLSTLLSLVEHGGHQSSHDWHEVPDSFRQSDILTWDAFVEFVKNYPNESVSYRAAVLTEVNEQYFQSIQVVDWIILSGIVSTTGAGQDTLGSEFAVPSWENTAMTLSPTEMHKVLLGLYLTSPLHAQVFNLDPFDANKSPYKSETLKGLRILWSKGLTDSMFDGYPSRYGIALVNDIFAMRDSAGGETYGGTGMEGGASAPTVAETSPSPDGFTYAHQVFVGFTNNDLTNLGSEGISCPNPFAHHLPQMPGLTYFAFAELMDAIPMVLNLDAPVSVKTSIDTVVGPRIEAFDQYTLDADPTADEATLRVFMVHSRGKILVCASRFDRMSMPSPYTWTGLNTIEKFMGVSVLLGGWSD